MTTVVYNGVRFHNCLTRQWDEEVRYDDSGTDLMFTRLRMTFSGVAHLQPDEDAYREARCWIGPDSAGDSPGTVSELYDYIRTHLSQPRGPLRVWMGDQPLLAVNPAHLSPQASAGVVRDADNGPKPLNVSLSAIAGTQLLHVSFTIETTILPDCANAAVAQSRGAKVISNRWSIHETVDASFFTTRTIQGRLRLSHPTIPAANYKHLTIPPLERGFRRDSIEFTVATNGLDCEYTVRDVQSHDAPPWPVARWQVTHREVTNDGVSWITDLSLRLDGAPSTPKEYLLQRALQIVLNRLGWEELAPPGGNPFKLLQTKAFIEGIAFVDHIGDANTIEVQFRVRRLIEARREFGNVLTVFEKQFATPVKLPRLTVKRGERVPEHKITEHPIPAIFGYDAHGKARDPSVLLLLHCYLQHPCGEHGMPTAAPSSEKPKSPKPEYKGAEPSITGYRTDTLADYGDTRVSDEATHCLYTFATAETTYATEELVAACPLAGGDGDDTSDATAFIVLGRPQTTMEIHMEAEAIGKYPRLPEPVESWEQDTGRGKLRGRLLRSELVIAAPKPTPQGTALVHRARIRMCYALNRKPLRDEQLQIAYLPTVRFDSKERLVRPTDFYDHDLTPGYPSSQ